MMIWEKRIEEDLVLPELNNKKKAWKMFILELLITFGIDGEVKSSMPTCTMEVKYKDNPFEDTFTILNMDSAFRQVKEDSGVQLHGILGSLFFQKYKYVIDFKSLVAYIRK